MIKFIQFEENFVRSPIIIGDNPFRRRNNTSFISPAYPPQCIVSTAMWTWLVSDAGVWRLLSGGGTLIHGPDVLIAQHSHLNLH